MAKRTEAKVKKYFREGRGQGELSFYQPWLTIQDVLHEVESIVLWDGKLKESTIVFQI